MNACLRMWKRNRQQHTYQTYKEKRNEYYREIRRAKRDKWNEFLEMNKSENVFKALQYCKAQKYRRTETLTFNNIMATTFKEKSTMLRNVIFTKSTTQAQHNEIQIQIQRREIIFQEMSNNEIRNAIFTSNIKKAAGSDNINFLCLQHAYKAKSTTFHILYRCLTNIGYQPRC